MLLTFDLIYAIIVLEHAVVACSLSDLGTTQDAKKKGAVPCLV